MDAPTTLYLENTDTVARTSNLYPLKKVWLYSCQKRSACYKTTTLCKSKLTLVSTGRTVTFYSILYKINLLFVGADNIP